MIRKAKLKDVNDIKRLIDFYSKKQMMLPRSFSELYENLRDFYVYTDGKKVRGCAALHITWEGIGEIKSIATDKSGEGTGTALLNACLKDAKNLGMHTLFTLTYVPEFFERHGFTRTSMKALPQKVWNECIRCPKFPLCDEVALIRKIR
jgi:amino-acid N-acetyltransferase